MGQKEVYNKKKKEINNIWLFKQRFMLELILLIWVGLLYRTVINGLTHLYWPAFKYKQKG